MFGCTYLRKCSECLYLSTTKSNPRGVARKWVGCMDVEGRGTFLTPRSVMWLILVWLIKKYIIIYINKHSSLICKGCTL